MRTPVSAFITFESEEGYNRAIAIKEQKIDINWLGTKLEFDAAPEPTDIIWENREITENSRMLRLFVAILATLVLLAISFTVIIVLKQKAMASNAKYTEANCGEIGLVYTQQNMLDFSM